MCPEAEVLEDGPLNTPKLELVPPNAGEEMTLTGALLVPAKTPIVG